MVLSRLNLERRPVRGICIRALGRTRNGRAGSGSLGETIVRATTWRAL
jgi:hypothetical protein